MPDGQINSEINKANLGLSSLRSPSGDALTYGAGHFYFFRKDKDYEQANA